MSESTQFSLLNQRRFAPFFWTQFLGVLNDNLFKVSIMVVLTYETLNWTSLDSGLLNNLIPGLFILPFVLFSATAGQLADKFEKSGLTRYIKMLEILIMVLAGIGWVTHTLWLLVFAVIGMGVHSTLFGPVKYAYLPQHLKQEELTGGNGLIEMGTFVGILMGEVLGATLVLLKPWGIELVAGGTIAVAVIGWLTSLAIPHSPAAAPNLRINWNPVSETIRNISFTRQNRPVFLSVVGNSWFWFYGAIILAQLPVYAKDYLHGDYSVFVFLLTVFSLGIGAGSLLCDRLSGHRVEIGLVPFGSIGLSVFGLDLYFASLAYTDKAAVDMAGFIGQHGSLRILFDCVMLGIFGGIYIVPLFAVIQTRYDPQPISRTIAGMNIMNAIFMVVAAGVAMVLLKVGFTIPEIFMATAIMNALVAAYIFSLVPEFFVGFLAWLLIHTTHRVRIVDGDSIPETGPAVLVCNHVSYVDAIVIMAASPRPIRFVVDHSIFKVRVLSWIFKSTKAIPMTPATEDPWVMEESYVEISQALGEGDLVCIFVEEKLTPICKSNHFKSGIKKIVERSPVPVIPMVLRGQWGSMLTRSLGNPFVRSFRRGLRSRLSLLVGSPLLPTQVTLDLLQEQLAVLRGDWQ